MTAGLSGAGLRRFSLVAAATATTVLAGLAGSTIAHGATLRAVTIKPETSAATARAEAAGSTMHYVTPGKLGVAATSALLDGRTLAVRLRARRKVELRLAVVDGRRITGFKTLTVKPGSYRLSGRLNLTPKGTSLRLRVTARIGKIRGRGFVKLSVRSTTPPPPPKDRAPVGLALNGATVAENRAAGTTVGTLAGSDPDFGDTLSYALVGGEGDADNAAFTLVGGTLRTARAFDFETQTTASIRARVSDGRGGTLDKRFTIAVANANDAPTALTLTGTTVAENQPVGTTVGTLKASDQDAGTTFTYALVGGTGATDNAAFAVLGDTLRTAAAFDYEAQAVYHVRLRASDGAGGTVEQAFTVTVTDVNDPPVVTTSATALPYVENDAATVIDPALTVTDPDDTDLDSASVRITSGLESADDELLFTNTAAITGSYDTATGRLTLTGAASKADWQIALRSVRYHSTSEAPALAKTVELTADDGTSTSAAATRTISITSVNDTPVLAGAGGTAAYTEDDATGVLVAPAITVADLDDANLASAQLQLTTGFVSSEDRLDFSSQNGITGSYNTTTGLLTLTGSASKASYETALRSVLYRNANTGDPSPATRTVSITVDDGAAANATSAAVTASVTVTATNDAPVVTAGGGTAAFTEGGAAIAVDPSVAVSDADDADLESATVTITTGLDATDDVLALPTTPGLSATYTAGTGTLAITGTATKAVYQAALRTVTYVNTDTDDPSATGRVVAFTVSDGAATSSPAATTSVTLTAVNDAPTLGSGGNTVTFEEDDTTGVLVNSGITVADVDDANLTGATVSIGTGFATAEDRLLFVDQNGIAGAYDATTGVLTLSGSATKADYQTALRTVRYKNIDTADPSTTQRAIGFVVNDGAASSNLSTSLVSSVDVNPHDDAPVLTAGGSGPTFTEGGSPVVVDAGLTVADGDDANLEGATVTIGAGYDSDDDRLAFVDQSGITATAFNTTTGTLALTGTATQAEYRDALRSITYRNLDTDDPSATTRSIAFTVTDGDLASNVATTDVTVAPVNDHPVLGGGAGSATFTEDDATGVIVHSGITVADVDSANLTGATISIGTGFATAEDRLLFVDQNGIAGAYNATTGVLSLSGSATKADYQTALRTIRYRNVNTGQPSTTTRVLSFTVTDGQPVDPTSDALTSDVAITSVNDAPTITAGSTSASYIEDQAAPVAVDTTITVADVDDTNLEGATITISGGYASGEDVLGFSDQNGITGVLAGATLTLSGTATKAQYQAALRSITYENTNHADPSTATRTVGFQVTDGGLTSTTETATVDIIAVNDAPVVTTSGGTAEFIEATVVDPGTGAVAVDPGVTVADGDDANIESATVTIAAAEFSAAEDALQFSNTAEITGSYSNGTLTLTGTATKAQYQAALRTVTYSDSSDTPDVDDTPVSFTVNDGAADSAPATRTVTIASADDPSTVTLSASTPAFTEAGSPVLVDDGLTVDDVDSDQLASATVCICTNRVNAEDELLYTTTSGITATAYDASTGTITLTGPLAGGHGVKSAFQAALRTIQYRNTNLTTPSAATRGITVTVNDGSNDSPVVTKSVTIISLNDAPVLGGGGNTVAYTEDDAATVVNAGLTLTDGDDTDIDSATVAITGGFASAEDRLTFADSAPITGSYNASTGVMTLSGTTTKADYQAALRTVKYVNDDHVAPSSASRTVSFTANDGEADSDPVTTTVTVAQNPDAPTLTAGTGNTQTFTENGTAVTVDDGIVVADVDSVNLSGATAELTTGFSSAQGDALSVTPTGGISGSYNASTGLLTLSGAGTKAQYQTVLRSVKYANTSESPTTSRTVSFTVTDETATASTASTHAVTIQPVNDAPVASGGGALSYTEGDAATAISPALSVTDVDDANLSGATVAITGNLAAGEDRLSYVDVAPISGAYDAGTGVLTLSGAGTVAQYQAALRSVRYDNTSDDPSTAQRTVTYTASDAALPATTTATVDVTAVNDAPVADDESFSGSDSAIGNTAFVGDDPTDGAPDPTGPQKTITADILAGDTDAEGDTLSIEPGTLASNDGGSVTVQADGDFTFTPAANTSCSDTSDFFDYTVSDGASPTAGTDTGRVTIAITDCVEYVNNQAGAGGNGTSSSPYDTLAAADTAASRTGDYIYVYQGDGTSTGLTGGVSLLASQRLVGAAEDLTVAGTTLETGANPQRPSISGSVTLAAGNTVEGLAITTAGANAINGGAGDASGTLDDLVLTPSGAAGGGISLNGTSGTWNVSDTAITATSGAQGFFASSAGTVNFASAGTISITTAGPAVSVLSTAVSGAIDTTTSTGGSYGWALNAVTGSLDLGGGSVSGHTSTETSVTAGTGDVTYAGTIGNGTGTSVLIQNRATGAVTLSGNITDSNDIGGGITMSGNSGGSTTFSGTTKTLSTGSSNAVDLGFSGGHTVSFTGGGLDIDTTSGSGISSGSANGFVAVTGTGNTIDVSAGISGTKGLNINGPDITASGLTFQRISTTAADDGIVLANTGSAGGLTVTGTGTSATGGVITASTGAGISLSSTRNVSLSGVNVTNGGDDGLRASSVTNLAIAGNAGTGLASAITGNGNAGGENGFDLTELAGTVTINNATVTGNYDNNIALTNDAATLTSFTVDDGSYGTTSSTGGNDSIQLVNTGAGNFTGAIKNADFMDSRGDHIQLITDNDPTTTSTQKLAIEGNTLNSTALSSTVLGGGIALGVGGGATQTVKVDNNDIDHAHGAPLSFNTTTGTSPNANWTVNNNRIGNTGEVKSGSVANSGFYINVNGDGNAKFNLTNNTIMQTDFTAVDAVQNDGDAAMNITMKGNVITEPGTTIDYAYGLRFVIGSDVPDNGTSCLDLGDPSTTALKNRFFGAGNSSQGYQDVRLRMAGSATVNLADYTGGAHDNAAVNSWVQTRNNIGGTPTTSSSQFDAASFYGQVFSCPLPATVP